MARVNKFRWDAANETLVANEQTTVAAGSLDLNLNLSTGNVSFGDVSRTVSLTSPANNALVNFTVTGTYNNKPRSETLLGPNVTTVYTDQVFDTVTSITFDDAIDSVSAGSGINGRTHWFAFNYNSSVCSFAAQVSVDVGTTLSYTFVSTLCDAFDTADIAAGLLTEGIVIPNPDNVNAFTLVMNEAAVSELAFVTYPFRYACIAVNDTTTDGAFTAYFLQQGTI